MIEEKLAQLGSLWSHELLEGRRFSEAKAERLLKHGIGQLTRPAGTTGLSPKEVAEFVNSVQWFLVEETRLGIPALVHEECLSGVLSRDATLFPQSIALASTWMPELAQEMAALLREQLLALGVRQGLAPVLDVARDPRWGRTEETFGEDPYLVASMGTAYVHGLQGDDLPRGVVATLKHFVGYGAAEGGLNCAPAHIPERELREVYLFPFECAIREGGALSVMNSYSELDGVPCAASRRLFTEILRGEWGFSGIVVSDYSAVEMLYSYHRLAQDKGEAAHLALEAGIDVEFPKIDCFGAPLRELLEQEIISESLIDAAVFRVLHVKFLLGLFERPYVNLEETRRVFSSARPSQAKTLAERIAEKSIVLLKNEGILPLGKDIRAVAVVGPSADEPRNYFGDYHFPAHMELFTMGLPNIPRIEGLDPKASRGVLQIPTVLKAVEKRAAPGTRVLCAKGCEVTGTSRQGFIEAVQATREADVALVVVGDRSGLTPDCTSGETRDAADLRLPGVQEELVQEVAKTGVPVVLVLLAGRPYVLTDIIDEVKAALVAWLPGEAGGEAIARVLFGEVTPGGKLPISFPCSPGQIPVYYAHKPSGGRSHWWGGYVDEAAEPLFPFGHGLSYTDFEYSDLEIEPAEVPPAGMVWISVKVRNVGEREGDEVVQLYICREHGSVTRPVRELKGFRRLTLKPGEERQLAFELPTDTLAYWDRKMELAVEPGEYRVMVGSSSEDIRLTATFHLIGENRIVRRKRGYFSRVRVEGD